MSEWECRISITSTMIVTVEAETEADAMDRAEETYDDLDEAEVTHIECEWAERRAVASHE